MDLRGVRRMFYMQMGARGEFHTHSWTLDSQHECYRGNGRARERGLCRLLLSSKKRTTPSSGDDDDDHPRQGNSRGASANRGAFRQASRGYRA